MKFIDEITDMAGKRVFIRSDLNVPQDEKLQITNDFRIKAALPTIKLAIEKKAKVIVASHLGRLDGKKKAKFSLKPVAIRLAELIGKEVKLAPDCVGQEVEEMIDKMNAGEVLMLENLRFYKSEPDNDPEFSAQLAKLTDIYVDDAFASAHRARASIEGITRYAKIVVGGMLMKDEITYLKRLISQPQRPLIAIIGGAKVSKKLGLLKNILSKVDKMIIGGAMAFPFLKVAGGKYKVVDDMLLCAKRIMALAKEKELDLLFPIDLVVAAKAESGVTATLVSADNISPDQMMLDIGPQTIKKIKDILSDARTIVWNGPMGKFELKEFAVGTMEIAHFLGKSKATVVVGGGDTVTAVYAAKEEKNVNYISTGGVALLEMLEGKELPGISALNKKGSAR